MSIIVVFVIYLNVILFSINRMLNFIGKFFLFFFVDFYLFCNFALNEETN